jgi:hypothetical protein
MHGNNSQQPAQSQAPAEGQYKVYARRWVVLGTYALLSLMVAVLWISFAPVAKEASKYLDDIGEEACAVWSLMGCQLFCLRD